MVGVSVCRQVDGMWLRVLVTAEMAGGRELSEQCTGDQHQYGQEPLQPANGCDEQSRSTIRPSA